MKSAFESSHWLSCALRVALVGTLMSLLSLVGPAQMASPQPQELTSVEGKVRTSTGVPIADATVLLDHDGHSRAAETRTNLQGTFVFPHVDAGSYTVTAKKSGWSVGRGPLLHVAAGTVQHAEVVLELLPAPQLTGAMEFDDKPNFTVAGVTDWNNVSIHGSDVNLRTSEALAQETLALKSGNPSATLASQSKPGASKSEEKLRAALANSPESFEANHQLGEFYCLSGRYREAIPLLESAARINPGQQSNAYSLALAYQGNGDLARAREQVRKVLANANNPDAHRLLGDLDEQLGDPLEAVRQYEQAAHLDPSEQNYFKWGTELLLHRADEPAVEVFTKGSSAHPDSARLLEGLGAALSAGGSYEEAARWLCQASDLQPDDPTPYLFLGKIEKASPTPLSCSEQKLARFVHDQPGNALANYYSAVALWKRDRGSEKLSGFQQAEALLEKAVGIDPKLGEAYLQLGMIHAAQGRFEQAIRDYQKAMEASPQLGEAHYRLGFAYRRIGEEAKAQQEFRLYEQGEKIETAAIERQRREVRQFLIILKEQPTSSPR